MKTLRMRGLNRNLCILRMLEDTFSLGKAQINNCIKMCSHCHLSIVFS